MSDTEGQGVPGEDLLGVKLHTGAVGLQRRGSKAMWSAVENRDVNLGLT